MRTASAPQGQPPTPPPRVRACPPQDVEGCLVADQVFVVQTRPQP